MLWLVAGFDAGNQYQRQRNADRYLLLLTDKAKMVPSSLLPP